MYLWRISDFPSLDGGGGLLFSGRWHTSGRPILYLATSAAGSMLEVLVHLETDGEDLPDGYSLLRVEFPDDLKTVTLVDAKGEIYRDNLRTSRSIGDAWLREGTSALAIVPSAIMPDTQNYLLNPMHPDASRIRIASTSKANYDPRLLRLLGKEPT
jgi:RES domain-containing protein